MQQSRQLEELRMKDAELQELRAACDSAAAILQAQKQDLEAVQLQVALQGCACSMLRRAICSGLAAALPSTSNSLQSHNALARLERWLGAGGSSVCCRLPLSWADTLPQMSARQSCTPHARQLTAVQVAQLQSLRAPNHGSAAGTPLANGPASRSEGDPADMHSMHNPMYEQGSASLLASPRREAGEAPGAV